MGSAAFAAYLRAQGLRPGDRVAVMMRNSVAAIAVVFGLARAGVAWVPVNAQQRGEGLRYLLTHSKPKLIVADEDLATLVTAVSFKTFLGLPPALAVGGGVVMWLLLHITQVMRVMQRAAQQHTPWSAAANDALALPGLSALCPSLRISIPGLPILQAFDAAKNL